MLQQGYLLLKGWRVLSNVVLFADVLSVSGAALDVVEVVAVRVKHDLGRVVEKDAYRLVRQVVSQAVLGRIVDPLFDPDFFVLRGFSFLGFAVIWSRHWCSLGGQSGVRWLTAGKRASLVQPDHGLALRSREVRRCLAELPYLATRHVRWLRQKLTNVGGRGGAGQGGGREQARNGAIVVHPLMGQYLFDSRPLGRVVVKDLGDEVSRWVRDSYILWEVVGIHPNALVSGLHIRCFEWRFADNKRVNYHSNRPNIHLVRMALLPLKHLRRYVVGRAADCALAFAIKLQLSS